MTNKLNIVTQLNTFKQILLDCDTVRDRPKKTHKDLDKIAVYNLIVLHTSDHNIRH